MRLVLMGDVGPAAMFHVGDEAMLEADVELAQAYLPGTDVLVVSRDPGFTSSRLGVECATLAPAVDAMSGNLDDWLERARLVNSNGEVVLSSRDVVWFAGGGNLTSIWPNVVAERLALARMAARQDSRIVLSGQSVGPQLEGEAGKGVREVLARAHALAVRDPDSEALCRSLGYEPVLFPDDALFLGAQNHAEPSAGDYLAVTLHPFAPVDSPEVASVAGQLRDVSRAAKLELLFVPHVAAIEGHDLSDVSLAEALVDMAGGTAHCSLLPAEVADVTRSAAAVISSRYHALVWATSAGTPALALPSSGYTRVKMLGAMAFAGLSKWSLWLEHGAAGLLGSAIVELLASRPAHLRRRRLLIQTLTERDTARRDWIKAALQGEAWFNRRSCNAVAELAPCDAWTLALSPTRSHLPPSELLRAWHRQSVTIAELSQSSR